MISVKHLGCSCTKQLLLNWFPTPLCYVRAIFTIQIPWIRPAFTVCSSPRFTKGDKHCQNDQGLDCVPFSTTVMEVSQQQGVHTISRATAVSAHVCFGPAQRDDLISSVNVDFTLNVVIMIALLWKVWALLIWPFSSSDSLLNFIILLNYYIAFFRLLWIQYLFSLIQSLYPCSSPCYSYCENFRNGFCKPKRMYILSNVCIWFKGMPTALKVYRSLLVIRTWIALCPYRDLWWISKAWRLTLLVAKFKVYITTASRKHLGFES